jgi:hypothetical protein
MTAATGVTGAEKYALIVTRVVGSYERADLWENAGAVLLAISHTENAEGIVSPVVQSDGYNSNSPKTVVPGIPGVACKKLVLIFGVPHENALEKLLDDQEAMKAALETAKKAAGVAEAAATVLRYEKDKSERDIQRYEKRIAELRETEVAGAARLNVLEGDLAKVKRAIGEKAYAEALKP